MESESYSTKQADPKTYRVLALHHIEQRPDSKPKIIDQITSGIEAVLADESAPVRSPWSKYIKSSLYLTVVKAIKKTERTSHALIPVDAPIGSLPSDAVAASSLNQMINLASGCAC